MYGSGFSAVADDLTGIEETLAEHSTTLARLDKATDTDRNKRVDPELRIIPIERHLGIG
jgi:hypothetical protein